MSERWLEDEEICWSCRMNEADERTGLCRPGCPEFIRTNVQAEGIREHRLAVYGELFPHRPERSELAVAS